jgi:hypothetical protein
LTAPQKPSQHRTITPSKSSTPIFSEIAGS